MRIRPRNAIALAVAGMILIGAGVALAQSQSPTPSPTSQDEKRKVVDKSAFLDDVARRLGIQRSRLDAALQAMALAEVEWAEDNGFITEERADRIRERIESGAAKGLGGLGFHGLGFGPHRFGLSPGFKGALRRGGVVEAVTDYLGLSRGDLREALRPKTLAQVARDQGKTVDGLKAAIRAAVKARLDQAVSAGRITTAQENALLSRFDSGIDDVVNGIPPGLTDLARRLGVPRARLIAAIKNAAMAQVDAALADGLISEERAADIKDRINSSPAWPLGGGFGWCGPGGKRFGLGFGRGHHRFDRSAMPEVEEAVGL